MSSAKGYSVLSLTNQCEHSNGNRLGKCFKQDVICEDECTSMPSCIAYGVQKRYCNLFVSSGPCKDGWMTIPGETAKTIDDIVASKNNQKTSCVVKGII